MNGEPRRDSPGREVCALIVLVLLLALVGTPQDPNIFGRITYARYAWEHGRLLTWTDPFSYTAPGYPWIDHEWGFNWAMWIALSLGGWKLIRVLRAVLFVGTLVIAAGDVVRRHLDTVAGPLGLALVAVPLMSGFHGPRPQAFSYLFFAIMLVCLRRSREQGPRWIGLALLLMPLWVNVHGGFLAGMFTFGVWGGLRGIEALRARDGKLATWLVGGAAWCALSTLMNPWGLAFPPFLLRTAMMPRPHIWEWDAPRLFSFVGISLLLAAVVTALAARDLWRRGRLPELAAIAAVVFAAARHQRHLPFALLAFAIFALPVASELLDRRLRRPEPAALVPVSRILLGLDLAVAIALVALVFRPLEHARKYPVRALDWMAQHELSGNLLVDWDWSQFVLFTQRERYQIAFDGRYETSYPDDVADRFFAWQTSEPGWEAMPRDPRTQLALVESRSTRDSLLAKEPGWSCPYRDEQAAVFVKAPAGE